MAPPVVNFFGVSEMPSLPIWWFVAVVSVVLAALFQWVSPKVMTLLSGLQFAVFVTSLWVFPHLAGAIPTAGQGWQYNFWNQTTYILDSGHTDASVLAGHNWPVPAILWSSLAQVLGNSSPEFFVAHATWLVRIAYLLPVYVFLGYLLDSPKARWAGMYVFAVGLWSTQPGLSMQALGYFLFIMLMAVIIARWKPRGESAGLRVAYILIGAALVLTHLLSALWGLLMAASLHLRKIYRVAQTYASVLLLGVFLGSWMLYVGDAFVEAWLPDAISRAFTLGFLSDVTQQVYGSSASEPWHLTVLLKTAVMLALLAFAGVALIFRLIRREKLSSDLALFGGTAAIAISTVAVAPLYSGDPRLTWEPLHRLFLMLLPIIAYFSVTQIANRAWATSLVLMVIILTPLSYASHYGPEYYAYVGPQTVESNEFIGNHVSQGRIISSSQGLQGFQAAEAQYAWSRDYDDLWDSEDDTVDTVVSTGDHARRMLTHLAGKPELLNQVDQGLAKDPNWALVYTSGTETIFRSGE